MLKIVSVIVLVGFIISGCEQSSLEDTYKVELAVEKEIELKIEQVPKGVSNLVFEDFRLALEELEVYSFYIHRGNIIDTDYAHTAETIMFGFKSKTNLEKYKWLRNVEALDYGACKYIEAELRDGEWKLRAKGAFDDIRFSWGEFVSHSKSCIGRVLYEVANDIVKETNKYDNQLDKSRSELQEIISFRVKAVNAASATAPYKNYGVIKEIDF